MSDIFEEPGLEPQSIDSDSEWDFYPDQPTAQFRVHNFKFLRVLTEEYRATGDLQYAWKASTLR